MMKKNGHVFLEHNIKEVYLHLASPERSPKEGLLGWEGAEGTFQAKETSGDT